VDFFKRYNDHYGHPAGDSCLRMIGGIFRSTFMRAGDLAARYGGEEFAVILPETAPEKAQKLAEKLRQKVIAQAIPHARSEVGEVISLSIGVVGSQVTTEHNAQWFMQEADRALYLSKENGRNLVTAAG
jgi:diguanylate cyclase (GGDEF)-like protein